MYCSTDSRYLRIIASVTLGMLILTLAACGGGSSRLPVTVTVSISPQTVTVASNTVQLFTATVSGSTNQVVTWSVSEATGGSVDNTGKYTAPATAGTYHVIATSQASNTASATAVVTVTAPPPVVTVAISPQTATIASKAIQQFTATVSGSTNQAVTWSVSEASGGSVDSTGRYTAPATAGTYHVVATSQASNTASATAAVTVTAPPITVAISPGTAALTFSGTQQFTATVSGSTNQAVTWSVSEASGGSVDSTGRYKAPATAGTYHVVATSQASNTASATAIVTVTAPPITVAISPGTAALTFSGTQQFSATVSGSTNQAVTWSVTEPGGGTVDSTGKYTAPVASGTYHVVVTSQASNTASATAVVTVTAPTITIAVSPTTAALTFGGTQQFTANVTGSTNQAITWSVTEIGGGTVDSTGKYTAPGTVGTYHVVATSQASGTALATAVVTVTAPLVTVSVSPLTASLTFRGTQQFSATIVGSSNQAVTWSVTEIDGGAIDSTGKYTAPATVGTFHVVATSQINSADSGSAVVTVNAPAPVFTSTAPLVSAEGVLYTYTPTATDPAGTTVIITLTSAPTDATLSSGTLSWTPTPAESRMNSSFTLTATTSAGGTATQSWTLNPTGTVRGSWIDTYWDALGQTQVPNDLSNTTTYSFSALVQNPDGTFTTIPGTGNADGTFTILNVPGGYYWLTAGVSNEMFWTSSSSFDLGADYAGRKATPAATSTALALSDLSGLDPSIDGYLLLVVPNQANSGALQIDYTATGFTTPYAGSATLGYPIDPTLGDATYIFQQEDHTAALAGGFSGYSTGPTLSLSNLAIPDGGSVAVTSGTFVSDPQSIDIDVHGADWAAVFANVSPDPATFASTDVSGLLQPYVIDRATNGSSLLLWDVTGPAETLNVDAGSIPYNNPFPRTWLPVYAGIATAQIQNNCASDCEIDNSYETTAAPINEVLTFAPLMSPIQSPTMNGASLFNSGATSTTTSVVLSWTAPTGLSPFGYEVSYYCVDQDCTGANSGNVYTSSTTVTMPPGALTPGYDYVFDITAMADSKANIEISPYRTNYPTALANIKSAPLLISANAQPAAIKGVASAQAVSKHLTTRTSRGNFIITKNGKKAVDIKARMLDRFNQHIGSKAAKTNPAVK